jgi:hypothetical protein
MNHDSPHLDSPGDLLASGYLDGTLTADERAQVEANPALLTRVEEFRSHRTVIGDIAHFPTAGLETHRDAAVAAALSEFDRLGAALPQPQGATILGWTPRTTRRVMAIAAAVVAIGIVGISAVGSGSDDTNSIAYPSASADAASAEAGVAKMSDTTGGDGGGSTETAPVATIGAINSPATAAITIDDAQQLRALVEQYDIPSTSFDAETAVSTAPTPCLDTNDRYLTDVIFRGSLGIAIMAADGTARVLDASCAVILEVRP